MSHYRTRAMQPAALSGSMRDFRVPSGDDLIGRVSSFYDWQNTRRQCGVWPSSRFPFWGSGPSPSF